MTTIADVVARVIAQPTPVIIIDTCNFLDLFRHEAGSNKPPRVPVPEIREAVNLLRLLVARPDSVHLIVPELVPGEYHEHADRIQTEFEDRLELRDKYELWLDQTANLIGVPNRRSQNGHLAGFAAILRGLADNLLNQALVLGRDQRSLDQAIARLIAKRRPSHHNEIKDSMNLEQSLELCSQLRRGGFADATVFISANTKDYAAAPTGPTLHAELRADFAAVSLEYFPHLRSALGNLRSRGKSL